MNDQALTSSETSVNPLGTGVPCRTGVLKIRRLLFLGFFIALTTAGCNSETLFKSNFDVTAANQPPSPMQEVGTASIDGPAGSVLVVAAPPDAQPSGKWLQISRPTGPEVASFQGKLTQQPGNGTYVFSTFLFIPQDTNGVATIQFEPFNQPVTSPSGFLHLDFLANNRVRIDDDDSTIFGAFPRNQVFLVQVTLNINDTSPNARIILSGAEASGQADRTVIPAFRPRAQQFGAVRIWMGFPHTGAFKATNVVVQREQQ